MQNFTQLLVVRFFLGVAEAGIWPAILVLISHWFPAAERARAYAFWMMNIAISSIITAPAVGLDPVLLRLAGAVHHRRHVPLRHRRTPVVAPGGRPPPRRAWCSVQEREYIEAGLAAEAAEHPTAGKHPACATL